MNKYWYVVQKEENTQKEYYIGFLFGRSDVTEEELIENVKDYCKEKKYRLALLIQVASGLPIINQVYPYEQTEESMMCLEYALQAVMKEEGTNYGLRA